MRTSHGLTKEQDELRLRGLRILARWIVRAHLESLRENGGGVGGPGSEDGLDRLAATDDDLPWTEDGHGR